MAIQNQRTITSPGVWGKDAQTTIPSPPVPGVAYRNPTLTTADFEAGQGYSSRADSAMWNEWQYRSSSMITEVERWGIMPYSPLTMYPKDSLCLGDGVVYQAIQENGPGTGNPSVAPGNTSFWKSFVDPHEVYLKLQIVPNTGLNFYINSASGVDAPGGGGSNSTAYKTFSFALKDIFSRYRAVDSTITLNFASGQYEALYSLQDPIMAYYVSLPFWGPSSLTLNGPTDRSARFVTPFSCYRTTIIVQNLTFYPDPSRFSTYGSACRAIDFGTLSVLNCTLQAQGTGTACIGAQNKAECFVSNSSCIGGAGCAYIAYALYQAFLTFSGTMSFNGQASISTAYVFGCSLLNTQRGMPAPTGAVSGARYSVYKNSAIMAFSPTFFPGTANGVVGDYSSYE